MPPTPNEDETQDEFIGRCIESVAEADPDTPQEQRIAMCYSSWRDAKGEIHQTDLKKEHDLAIAKHLRKICGINGRRNRMHTESFEWVPEIKAELPDGARIYKVKMLRSGFTYHVDMSGNRYKRKFSDDESKRSARTMIGKFGNLDHFQPIEKSLIAVDCEFNDKEHDTEALVYCDDPYVNQLYDDKHILGASVEYDWRDEKCVPATSGVICDALEQLGVLYTGFAFVTDRFEDNKPASPYTSVERYLTMTESSARKSSRELNQQNKNEEKKKMSTNANLEKRLASLEKRFDQLPRHILSFYQKVNAKRAKLQSAPMTPDQVKTRLEELAKTRALLEEKLYPESELSTEEEATIRADLEVIWAEIYALEQVLADLYSAPTIEEIPATPAPAPAPAVATETETETAQVPKAEQEGEACPEGQHRNEQGDCVPDKAEAKLETEAAPPKEPPKQKAITSSGKGSVVAEPETQTEAETETATATAAAADEGSTTADDGSGESSEPAIPNELKDRWAKEDREVKKRQEPNQEIKE